MNLKVSPRKGNRKYLSIEKAYRDPITKKPRSETIKSLGYLDVLEKKYKDPIAHFRRVIKKMTEEEKAEKTITLTVSEDEVIPEDTDDRKNFGYAAIMKIYHELLLHEHLAAKARYQKFEFNTNSIMLLLVVSRILSPGSKKKAFEEKGRYFERFSFELADVYRALSHFAKIGEVTQRFLHEQIVKKYGRDTSVVYFDATNFYFEIDEQDEMRKRGICKEHRPNPIVQMGLALDRDGIPLRYKAFPGNRHDSETFRSIIGDICRNYGAGRIIAVGDMGIITADNIWYLIGGRPHKPLHGYVFSYSVRKAAKKFKEYVLDPIGYADAGGKPWEEGGEYKVKSRRIARTIEITVLHDGEEVKKKKNVYEKQVVFWSKAYADKAKAERDAMLNKAQAFIRDPSKYKRHTGHGSAKYIKGIDKDTGEVEPEQILSIDYSLVREEEKYDGYYAIVTSELGMPKDEVIDTYRGLWEIEETFRIAKSDLEARPIFVSRGDRIDAHLLICFIALVILRILQKKTGHAHSAAKLIDAMNRISCSHIQGNRYLFDYRSPVTDAIGEAAGIDFKQKYRRLGEMKKSLGDVKK
jgi:transposase